MKFKITLFALLVFAGSVAAQQRSQFTQYMNNNYILNPAAGGTEDYIDLKACFRRQWVGINSSPTTYYLTGHAPLGKWRGKPNPARDRFKSWHSLGGTLYNDVTGPTSRSGAYMSYGYNLPIASNLRVSMSAQVGVQQYSLDGSKLNFYDETEVSNSQSQMVPDVTVAAWIYNTRVYGGIAVSQVLQNELDFSLDFDRFSRNGTTPGEVNTKSKLNNHYFFTGGVRIPLNPDFTLVPSFMVKYVMPAPPSLDINGKLKYQDLLWVGVSTRLSYVNGDSFSAMIGGTINKWIDIGYSYDATVSGLAPYTSGSHEILVGVRLRPKSRVICPSNFW